MYRIQSTITVHLQSANRASAHYSAAMNNKLVMVSGHGDLYGYGMDRFFESLTAQWNATHSRLCRAAIYCGTLWLPLPPSFCVFLSFSHDLV